MKKFLLFLLIFLSRSVFAQEGDFIIATGFGATAEEAKYAALTAAVEQALGVMISAETRVEDGELIREKVRANTQGYIESYTVLSNVKDDKVYIATVKALVSKKRILEQITEISHLNDERLAYEEAACQATYGGAIMCNGGDIALFNMNYGIHADSYALLRYYTSKNVTETQLYFRMTLRQRSGFDSATDQDGASHELIYVYMGDEMRENPDRTISQDYIVVLESGDGFAYLNQYAQSGLEVTVAGSGKTVVLRIPGAYIRGFVRYVEDSLAEGDD